MIWFDADTSAAEDYIDDAVRVELETEPRSDIHKAFQLRIMTMAEPEFVDGRDCTTFAPFILIDCRDSEWKDVRLEFSDHAWTQKHVGSDYIGDCYLNGYGIQGLVLAARVAAGLEPFTAGMEPDSEGDTCYIHFADLETAVETATLARDMIHDPSQRAACAELAVAEELDDI